MVVADSIVYAVDDERRVICVLIICDELIFFFYFTKFSSAYLFYLSMKTFWLRDDINF